jgi:drug/metabolite transporter (DMT)-like permease
VNAATTPDTRSWLPGFLGNAVIWGSSFIFIKIAVGTLHPAWVGAGRIVTGAVTLLIILALMKEKLPSDKRLWAHMAIPGVVGIAIPFALFAYGEERISSLLAGIWNATTGLWVLPIAVFVYRIEKFSVRAAIGLLLGFAGVLVVLGFWNADSGDLTGQLMCGAAALCYGITIPYIKKFVSGRSEASGVALAAMQVMVASVASVIGALVLAGPPLAPSAWGWQVTASILALGVFGSGIAFALNMRVIKLAGASTAAFVTYLVPVFAVILGILVLNESPHWNQAAGALIVLAGVAVAQGVFSRKNGRKVSATAPTSGVPLPAKN